MITRSRPVGSALSGHNQSACPSTRVKRVSRSSQPRTTIRRDHVNESSNQYSSHTPDMVPSQSHAVLAGVNTGEAWPDGRLWSFVPGDRHGRVPTGKEMRGAAKISGKVQHGGDSGGRAGARPGSHMAGGPSGWGPKNLSPDWRARGSESRRRTDGYGAPYQGRHVHTHYPVGVSGTLIIPLQPYIAAQMT